MDSIKEKAISWIAKQYPEVTAFCEKLTGIITDYGSAFMQADLFGIEMRILMIPIVFILLVTMILLFMYSKQRVVNKMGKIENVLSATMYESKTKNDGNILIKQSVFNIENVDTELKAKAQVFVIPGHNAAYRKLEEVSKSYNMNGFFYKLLTLGGKQGFFASRKVDDGKVYNYLYDLVAKLSNISLVDYNALSNEQKTELKVKYAIAIALAKIYGMNKDLTKIRESKTAFEDAKYIQGTILTVNAALVEAELRTAETIVFSNLLLQKYFKANIASIVDIQGDKYFIKPVLINNTATILLVDLQPAFDVATEEAQKETYQNLIRVSNFEFTGLKARTVYIIAIGFVKKYIKPIISFSVKH